MAVVHAMKDDAHTLPCGHQCRNTNHPADSRESPPSTWRMAQSDHDRSNEAEDNGTDSQPTSEDDTGTIAVADCPADEVRVSLAT